MTVNLDAVMVADSDVMEADDLDAVLAIESDTVVTVVVDAVTTRMRGLQLTQVQCRLGCSCDYVLGCSGGC